MISWLFIISIDFFRPPSLIYLILAKPWLFSFSSNSMKRHMWKPIDTSEWKYTSSWWDLVFQYSAFSSNFRRLQRRFSFLKPQFPAFYSSPYLNLWIPRFWNPPFWSYLPDFLDFRRLFYWCYLFSCLLCFIPGLLWLFLLLCEISGYLL